MPSPWSPKGLKRPEGPLPSSNWGPFSTPCDTLSLGRSVPMVGSVRDVFPVLSRDNWSGMTSSWWTLSWCCIFGGHDIFLIGLGGDERDWGWCWDNFLLWNKGLAARLIDSLDSFLNGALPAGSAGTMLSISVDLAMARFKEGWLLTCKELWLYVLRKRGLSSLIVGGSVTEILRRGTDNVPEDEECSEEFDGCFARGRLSADLLLEESFLVQELSSWLFVFLSREFSL